MRVPEVIYADRALIEKMDNKVWEQMINVAILHSARQKKPPAMPGVSVSIVAALLLPDFYWKTST